MPNPKKEDIKLNEKDKEKAKEKRRPFLNWISASLIFGWRVGLEPTTFRTTI